eukprot:RCo021803
MERTCAPQSPYSQQCCSPQGSPQWTLPTPLSPQFSPLAGGLSQCSSPARYGASGSHASGGLGGSACSPCSANAPKKKSAAYEEVLLSKAEMQAAMCSPQHTTHLVLIIHGIGPQGENGIAQHLKLLTETRDDVLRENFPGLLQTGTTTVEFRSFDRHAAFWKHHQKLQCLLWDLSPLGRPGDQPRVEDQVRYVHNKYAMDVITYVNPCTKVDVLRCAIRSLNAAYHSFVAERRPQGRLLVSLVGHSLGGNLAYDILAYHGRELAFPAHCLFMMGTQVGFLLAARGHGLGSLPCGFPLQGASGPPCNNIFNVFHPHDPIAYRIEPFFSAELARCEPAQLPSWKTLGHRYRHEAFAQVATGAHMVVGSAGKSAVKMMARMLPSRSRSHGGREANPPATPGPTRRDFVVQADVQEKLHPYMALGNAHSMIWTSRDTMLFMISQLIRASLVKAVPAAYSVGSISSSWNMSPMAASCCSSPSPVVPLATESLTVAENEGDGNGGVPQDASVLV